MELNVFVDAWDLPTEKVGKNLFFHLLVGFDPDGDQTPDFWLEKIYRECRRETKNSGGRDIVGIGASLDELVGVLKGSDAILIPAHLHSTPNAFKTRSVDDIYTDPSFLRHAREHFSALEVGSPKTAAFFDGQHDETGQLLKTCIRSSDSHEATELGSRFSFALMENPTFQELKAALEIPFRITIEDPDEPSSYVAGLHIQGQFFPDLWLSLSPYSNVLMGVKGSGKTSILESLRFALGAEVPRSREESVRDHLANILGPNGKVSLLLKRDDGAKVLVQRSLQDERFKVTFEDDREEYFDRPEGLLFATYVLGWHEIEQAATDVNIRRLYLDTIAGKQEVRRLEEEANALTKQIRHKHDVAANKYNTFRSLHDQVERLEELRRGLQELTEAKLIDIRNQYEAAVKHRDELELVRNQLGQALGEADTRMDTLLGGLEADALGGDSPLSGTLQGVTVLIKQLVEAVDSFGTAQKRRIELVVEKISEIGAEVQTSFDKYYATYELALSNLTADQRKLLETHQRVMEETKSLPRLKAERSVVENETKVILQELSDLCDQVVSALDRRTELRQKKVAEINERLDTFNVRVSVEPYQSDDELAELTNRFKAGAEIWGHIQTSRPDERRLHRRLQQTYLDLKANMLKGYALFFNHAEFGNFIGMYENDDLRITFRVGKKDEEFSPIDQLSAGQRCTAVFPLILKLEEWPLFIDQPEDNLEIGT